MPSKGHVALLCALFGFGTGFVFNILLKRLKVLSKGRLARVTGDDDDDDGERRKKRDNEMLEVIFTHDRIEYDRTKGVSYLELSDINDFTPRNLKRVLDVIRSAERTIDAAVYLFNVKDLGQAFVEAHERGVVIRMVGCTSMAGSTGTQFPKLQDAGIRVRFKAGTTMIMHHKFCLIDAREDTPSDLAFRQKQQMKIEATAMQKKKKGIAEPKTPVGNKMKLPQNGVCITGSCNWTMQGFAGNWENIMLTSNSYVIGKFQQEFDRIWKDFIDAANRTAMHRSMPRNNS